MHYCVAGTGNTVVKAVDVLKENGVSEENIIVLNLFSTPNGKNENSTAFTCIFYTATY